MKKGVLVMAYGSPEQADEILPYYTDIRRGNPPTDELLAELKERYQRIGGKSPLLEITTNQAHEIAKALGDDYKVYLGMRHWHPWIKDAVKQMKEDGIKEAVGLVMAPHFSKMSVAQYIKKVETALSELNADIKFSYIQSWHSHPLYIKALDQNIDIALQKFSEEEKKNLVIVYTAHSLPERILLDNDPYKDQLLETSELLSEHAGIKNWTFAFQSAGRTNEKWLGPDLLETLNELASQGTKAVLVCSVGFVADHLEVLYDIDIEAKEKAKDLGIHLERASSLNANPIVGEIFKDLIKQK